MINPKFIKLNEIYSDKSILPVILNTAFIASVKTAKQGDTIITMYGKHSKADVNGGDSIYFFVKETMAEVEAML